MSLLRTPRPHQHPLGNPWAQPISAPCLPPSRARWTPKDNPRHSGCSHHTLWVSCRNYSSMISQGSLQGIPLPSRGVLGSLTSPLPLTFQLIFGPCCWLRKEVSIKLTKGKFLAGTQMQCSRCNSGVPGLNPSYCTLLIQPPTDAPRRQPKSLPSL